MPYTPRNSPHVLNLRAEVEDLREEVDVLRSYAPTCPLTNFGALRLSWLFGGPMPRTQVLQLSRKDQLALVDALLAPPAPNEALKKAFAFLRTMERGLDAQTS